MCASSSSRRAIYYGVSGCVLASVLVWRSEWTVTAQDAAARVTVAGCLVDEREYAGARGLASGATSDRTTTQLVIIPDAAATASVPAGSQASAYALTGPRENGLAKGSHHRVVLEGVIERGLTSAPAPPPAAPDSALTPTGAAGVTADGGPAHEPTDAAAPRRSGDRTRPPDERPVSVAELDRINVTTARVLDDMCGLPLMPGTPAESRASDAVPSPTATTRSSPSTVASTITGCLVRRDADDSSASGILTLLAYPRDERPLLTRGAVPGSFPSGSGSGTVGTGGAATGSAEPIAYRVTGDESALAPFVGQRIEATGIVDASEVDTAHPSATRRAIRVTSFRAATGNCR
jgi:hypothetical protein